MGDAPPPRRPVFKKKKKPVHKEQWHQLTLGSFDIGLLRVSSSAETLGRIVLEELGARTPENRKDLTPYIIRLALIPVAPSLAKKRDTAQAGKGF